MEDRWALCVCEACRLVVINVEVQKKKKNTFLAATMLGLSIAVLFAISRRSLFSLRGTASFWLGDNRNLAVAQRIAATP